MEGFFGKLPRDGIWNSVGLEREQFLGILTISTVMFLLIDGPVWQNLHASHFYRIVWSYGIIPILVAGALSRNHDLGWRQLFGGTVLVSMIKLLLTAAILVAVAIAGK